MANKTRTISIKGNTEYAKVADRLNEFRKVNPRSKISVKHYHGEEGNLTSRVYIWKDLVDAASKINGKTWRENGKLMSTYGNKEPQAFFAEVFASYILGSNSVWVKVMESYLTKKGLIK